MAAPSLFDGISRAIEEIAIPSVAVLTLIGVIKVFYGGQEAGMIYVIITAAVCLGIYTAAKYWNTRYTLGFVIVGLVLWVGLPGVIPQLIPDQFATLGSIVVLIFLLFTGQMIFDKW